MKILMVSIFAPHFLKWTQQLEDSEHDIYWLDVFDSNTKVKKIDFVHQITGWRYKWNFPGRYFLKKNAPGLTLMINRINERNLQELLAAKIREIKPDVVHSFVMYLATAPILEVMKNFPKIKWIYSSWGSDLYFYRNRERELLEMKLTLPELDYMFSDCRRDYDIAVENGFKGEFLGVFPGGGGFDFSHTDALIQPFQERNLILIKGYQGLHGRCIQILMALTRIAEELRQYTIKVFGANEEVKEFVRNNELKNWKNFEVLGMIPHAEVMKLMGEALLCIGNSQSDGMPNTLLETIVMGAFPVQSNPGGATAELIEDEKNGLLIKNPEDPGEISNIILRAIKSPGLLKEGVIFNNKNVRPKLERSYIQTRVLKKYQIVERDLKCT